jgi:hypothetical protein
MRRPAGYNVLHFPVLTNPGLLYMTFARRWNRPEWVNLFYLSSLIILGHLVPGR